MKKYLLGFFAFLFAIGLSSFSALKTSEKKLTSYYWYSPDGLTNLGFGEFPNTGCQAPGSDCAKGYVNPPSDPTSDIPQTTVARN